MFDENDRNATEAERVEALLLGVHLHQFSNNHPAPYRHRWTVCDDEGRNLLMHLSCTNFAKSPRAALDEYIALYNQTHFNAVLDADVRGEGEQALAIIRVMGLSVISVNGGELWMVSAPIDHTMHSSAVMTSEERAAISFCVINNIPMG